MIDLSEIECNDFKNEYYVPTELDFMHQLAEECPSSGSLL